MYKIFLLILFYLPFQLALNPAEGIDLASIRIIILVLFLVWLAKGLKNKKINIQGRLITWFIIPFLFINALSFIVARNTDWSLRKLLFLFSIFPIYFVSADLINKKEKITKALQVAVVSGAIASLVGIAQFALQFIFSLESVYKFWANYVIVPFLGNSFSKAVLENPSWLVNISANTYLRATSFFPDPHMFSFFLGLLIPIALVMFIRNKPSRLFYSVCFLLLIFADALTFSRGGYLGLAAGAGAFLAVFWQKIGLKYKLGALFLALAAVLVLIVPNPVSQRFASSFNLKEGSNEGRIEMWTKASEIALDNPLLGVGIGNYPLEIKASADYREPIYAHNTYLDIASETGIISALIWIGILISAAKAFYKKAQKDIIFLGCFASIIIFSAHSFFETAIYSPVVLTLFLVILSFSNQSEINEKNI